MTTINTIEDLIHVLDEHPQWLEALRARLLTRELLELPEKFAAFVETTNRRFEQIDQRFDRGEQRLGTLETTVKGLRDDMGILKGSHARNVAVEDAADIARNLGLRRTRTLSRDGLWDLTEAADTTAIAPSELRSFRRADLVMEATDRAGKPCYLAVEISFTVNGRDTIRARRNAEFLTRFTGKPASAVVAGLRRDDRIQPDIESAAVFWYQLNPSDLEAD